MVRHVALDHTRIRSIRIFPTRNLTLRSVSYIIISVVKTTYSCEVAFAAAPLRLILWWVF